MPRIGRKQIGSRLVGSHRAASRAAMAVLMFVALLATTLVTSAGTSTAATGQTISVDGTSSGSVFNGVGGLSAGASSALLSDYPPQQRAQILDYLFEPDYGASMQILKVEIGGDTNSTDGTEPSHERQPGQVNCNLGYEWWLMEQAKARNPNIKLYALEWGAPAWVGAGTNTLWTSQNISYLLSWLGCARQHGLQINYLGGWNEKGYNADWYVALRQALDQNGYGTTTIVADDSYDWTQLAASMDADPALKQAVGVIGEHDPCSGQTTKTCSSPTSVQAVGKPIWNSEQGAQDYNTGAPLLAQELNRGYIDGKMTGLIAWSLIWSAYASLPLQGSGMMLANTPWSGHYVVDNSMIWAMAHTTQFTEPGWRYIDTGSTKLSGGGSVVSLRSPTGGDWSSIAETATAQAAQSVTYHVGGGLSTGTVHVWATNLESTNSSDWFSQLPDVQPQDGTFTLTLQPGYIYSLTTTTGQHKGTAVAPPDGQWSLPYSESFNEYPAGATPRFFSDVGGSFQTAPCVSGEPQQGSTADSRAPQNMCLQQEVTAQPVQWDSIDNYPLTVVGDPTSWRNYQVGVDALLEQPGYVELDARSPATQGRSGGFFTSSPGYHFRIDDQGQWSIYKQDTRGDDTTLASGTTASALGVGGWHRLGLEVRADEITAFVDHHQLTTVLDTTYPVGQVGLETAPWVQAQFDNLSVTPLPPAHGAPPVVGPVTPDPMAATAGESTTIASSVTNPGEAIPQSQMTAAASSTQPGYPAGNAIDGNPATLWSTEFSPTKVTPPQSFTLDLGQAYDVDGLSYLPRQDGNPNGIIGQYEIDVSTDGTDFTPVSSGTWTEDATLKNADFTPVYARYVRLVAVTGHASTVTAAEINAYGSPAP